MNYQEAFNNCKEQLKKANISEYDSDAWILFEYVTGMKRSDMFIHGSRLLDKESEEKLFNVIQRRTDHVPVQYITGVQNFMGYDFKVNENVLIPRFDTEILVENILKKTVDRNCGNMHVLDICTGSGCIIISLMLLGRYGKGVATDISEEALKVARHNKELHGVNNIEFINTDLTEGLEGTFDIVVSNPPYIETSVVNGLETEVKDHEPRLALDGGEDGLIFYRRIAEKAPSLLNEKGILAVEIGYNQGSVVKELFENAGFTDVLVIKDYAGLDRVVMGLKDKTGGM